jgi:hypothetical protein
MLEQVARRKAELLGQCETGDGGVVIQPREHSRAVAASTPSPSFMPISFDVDVVYPR